MADSEPAPGPLPGHLHVAAGSGMGGVKVGPRGGSSPCSGRRPAPPSVCLPCGLSSGRCTCFRAAVPRTECGGFVGAHPEAPVRPASSRRGLRGSEAKAAHAQSPPASSLHLVVARTGSHKGPKQGSQGARQGKGPPSPTAAGGWGLNRAAGRRAMSGGASTLPPARLREKGGPQSPCKTGKLRHRRARWACPQGHTEGQVSPNQTPRT